MEREHANVGVSPRCTHLNSLTGPAQSISYEIYGITGQLKMCGGKSILPGVVSLYTVAYLCKSSMHFTGRMYLCGFTRTSADTECLCICCQT